MFERINNAVKVKSRVRHDMLEDRPHVIVPTVMILEGVWPGSGGPIFYPGPEIQKSVPTWNHKPALIYHPDMGDSPLSGCSPKIINNQKCGVTLEARCGKDTKLKSETWFDEKRLKKLDESTLAKIENGEVIEVSTGVILQHDGKKGVWNGKKYLASAFNLVGDHLAVLPSGVGACSVKDGAGLHQNQNAYIQRVMKFLAKKGISHPFMLNLNELSHSQIHSALTMAIRSKLESSGNRWDGWIEEVFDDYVIFYAGGSLFQINYKAKDTGIELTGEMQAVKRIIQYKTVKNEQLVSNEKEGDQMTDKKKAIVDSLIANGWKEEDRQILMGFDEPSLEKLSAIKSITKTVATQQPVTPAPAAVAAPVTNCQQPGQVMNYEQFMNMLDDDTREMIEESVQVRNEQKAAMIQAIMNSGRSRFTKEYLETKSRAELEGMVELLGTQRQPTNNGVQILQPRTFAGAVGSAPVVNNHVQKPMGTQKIIGRKVENKKA